MRLKQVTPSFHMALSLTPRLTFALRSYGHRVICDTIYGSADAGIDITPRFGYVGRYTPIHAVLTLFDI